MTSASKRGEKVWTKDGEGAVLINGFDERGYVMVTITASGLRTRIGLAEIYHASDLYDPTPDDLARIPSSPPPWWLDNA